MRLKPSEIRFSQDSINNVFDRRSYHSGNRIGDTLDDLCEGRCCVESIPTITVINEDGCWISADNRRLWVFRELERLGKCETIPVNIGDFIRQNKRTSFNGGTSIRVRGPPGGFWYTRPAVSNSSKIRPAHASDMFETRPSPYRAQYSRRSGLFDDEFGPSNLMRQREARAAVASLSNFDKLSINSKFDKDTKANQCTSRFSYGIKTRKTFVPGLHPETHKVVEKGVDKSHSCFYRFIKKGQIIRPGEELGEKILKTSDETSGVFHVKLYKSIHRRPILVKESGCSISDSFAVDLGALNITGKRCIVMKMIYIGGNDIKVIFRASANTLEFHTTIALSTKDRW